ncbi:MAG: NusA N-terminal domain-containing protein, partial [Eubacteriales bacterium]
MAKRVKKSNNELDGKEFFAAIAELEEQKKIKQGYMIEKITQALTSAYRRDYEGVGDNLTVELDPVKCTVRVTLRKEVVETVDNAGIEISLEEAREQLSKAEIGDIIKLEIKPKNFG